MKKDEQKQPFANVAIGDSPAKVVKMIDPETVKVRIYGDRVLILPDPEETRTQLGFIIPDTAREPVQTGLVMKFGIKCTETVVNSRVLFGKHAGAEIIVKGFDEPFLVMREAEIICEV